MSDIGRSWEIVKLRPNGDQATRYTGIEIPSAPGWIAAQAQWVHGVVDIGHFQYRPGDVLDEFFSLEHGYNLFVSRRADGQQVGWYCNVTYPTLVNDNEIIWHDLWVDVIIDGQGELHVVDEDELEEAGVRESDPALFASIQQWRDDLIDLYRSNSFPFSLYNAGQ